MFPSPLFELNTECDRRTIRGSVWYCPFSSDINKIYEKTKTQVEKTLSDLDGQVEQEFDAGAAEAKKAFEDYVGKRMEDYKSDRYGGLFGWTKWIRDQFVGLPDEVNVLTG